MRQVASCADSLVLLGEMLEVASGYVDQCREMIGQEEAFMAELARDQIFFLRKHVAKLDERLRDLDADLSLKTTKQT